MIAPAMTEIEIKCLPAGPADAKQVRRTLADVLCDSGFRVGSRTKQRFEDTYLDTADRDLFESGWTLRIRKKHSGDAELTLKHLAGARPSGIFSREELSQPIAHLRKSIRAPEPGPVTDALEALGVYPKKLETTLRQNTVRHKRAMTHPDIPDSLIEWAEDKVTIGAKEAVYTEHEFELMQGEASLLTDIDSLCAAQTSLITSRMSKLQRGQLIHSRFRPAISFHAFTPARLDSSAAWRDLARKCIDHQHATIVALAPAAFESVHVEAVHQMRVQTRRLRASLAMFADVLAEPQRTHMRNILRKLTSRLGRVRDLDVHLMTVANYNLAKPDKPISSDYTDYWRNERQKALARLRRTIDKQVPLLGQAHARLTIAADAEHQTPILTALQATLFPHLRHALNRDNAIRRTSNSEKLHELRIALKRVRYQLSNIDQHFDAGDAQYANSVAQSVARTRKLQKILGDLQDTTVAAQFVQAYRAQNPDGPTRGLNGLLKQQRRMAKSARQKFFPAWAQFAESARILLEA